MVSLVLVSHSKSLAMAVRELVRQMTGLDFTIAVAAGVGDDHEEIGTDAVHIAEVLAACCGADGVLVLMDLGSAVLSAETALELLEDPSCRDRIRLCPAPLVEGAIAAAVQAKAGSTLDEVYREALRALAPKEQQILPDSNTSVPASEAASGEAAAAEIVFTVNNEHGLHARPAAVVVQAAAKFSAEVEISNESSGRGPASARSLTSLTLLQIRKGDCVKVAARGADAEAALRELAALAQNGFGERVAPQTEIAAGRPSSAHAALKTTSENGAITGTPAADGIAVGPLRMMESSWAAPDDDAAGDPAVEFSRLTEAMRAVRRRVSEDQAATFTPASQRSLGTPGAGDAKQILAAQGLILDDPVLIEKLRSLLHGRTITASRAWLEVTQELANSYEALGDPYLRGRAADVRDISRRVLHELAGQQPASLQLKEPAILMARELLPSEAAACDPALVLGVIAGDGSPTSHSAILLRSKDIPMIVGVRGLEEITGQGKTVAMNGATGEIWVEPAEGLLRELRARKERRSAERCAAAAMRSEPSVTLDGERIQILANVGNAQDAALAAREGAEGIGLLRTEFLYPARLDAPGEEEQIRILRNVFAAFDSGPIVVRTLDAGADKPLPFLAQDKERNPFLGVRGIRLALRQPAFFLSQLRAILVAARNHDVRVMFPMISDSGEIVQARALLEQAHAELSAAGTAHRWPVQSGIMVEVPAAALLAEELAVTADFFSIGTNDLTQYVLAAERGNAQLTSLQDALHPAVLRLLKSVVDGAAAQRRHVSVCGDAASDPAAAVVFGGLGIRSLSVRPNAVAEMKALFRSLKIADVQQLAGRALASSDAVQVRALATEFLRASR